MVDPQILLQESTANELQESTSTSVSGSATDGSTWMSARSTRTIYDKIMQLSKDGKIAEKEGSTDDAIKQQRGIYKEIVVNSRFQNKDDKNCRVLKDLMTKNQMKSREIIP